MSGTPRSDVFHNFTLLDHAKRIWLCNFCRKPINGRSSSNLRVHLTRMHDDIYTNAKDFQEKLNKTIAAMVYDYGGLADRFVESPGFREVVRTLNANVSVPSRHTLNSTYLPILYDERVGDAVKAASENECSCAIDAWSWKGRSYIVVVVSFIDETFVHHERVVVLTTISGAHTAENLKDLVDSELAHLGLSVHTVSSDAAVNMRKMCRLMGVDNVRCCGHFLDNSLSKSFEKTPAISSITTKVKALAASLNQSYKRREVFESALDGKELDRRNLPQAVATRWNSLYYLLSAVDYSIAAILGVQNELGVDLQKNDVHIIHDLVELLKPFEMRVSSSFSPCSDVLVVYFGLMEFLDKKSDDESVCKSVRELAVVIRSELQSRYEESYATNSSIRLTLLVDPVKAFRSSIFRGMTSSGAEEQWTSIESEFLAKFPEVAEAAGADQPAESAAETPAQEPTTEDAVDIFAYFTAQPAVKKLKEGSEFRRYKKELTESPVAPGTDILCWWRKNAARFPLLAKIARRLLSVQASSVSAERVFSKCTLLARRSLMNRLHDRTFAMRVLVNANKQANPRSWAAERVRAVRLPKAGVAAGENGEIEQAEYDRDEEIRRDLIQLGLTPAEIDEDEGADEEEMERIIADGDLYPPLLVLDEKTGVLRETNDPRELEENPLEGIDLSEWGMNGSMEGDMSALEAAKEKEKRAENREPEEEEEDILDMDAYAKAVREAEEEEKRLEMEAARRALEMDTPSTSQQTVQKGRKTGPKKTTNEKEPEMREAKGRGRKRKAEDEAIKEKPKRTKK